MDEMKMNEINCKLKTKLMKMIEDIVRRMTEGEINPLEAVREIDKTIGGITRVDYKQGKKFSNRKDLALWLLNNHKDIMPFVFGITDNKQVDDAIWKFIKPEFEKI